MPRKGENIRKRKDGRWEGRYKRGVKANGQPDYGSVYGKTYKEVQEKLLLAKHDTDRITTSTNLERRFSEVLLLWQQTNRIRLKGGSEQRYEYLIQTHILPHLGYLELSQISAASINTFLMEKLTSGRLDGKGGLSPSYVSSIMIIVKSAINFAVAEQMCPPLKTPIYKPKAEIKELEILDHIQQSTIEQYARSNLNSTAIGILITLYAGLRIGEVCALTWDDIDLDNQIIHIRHTIARIKNQNKNGKAKTVLIVDEPKTKSSKRDIPIHPVLMLDLVEYKKIAVSNYVTSDNMNFISPRTFEYRYHRLLDNCAITSINYHALRHTFASRCVEAGVDIKSLSDILGHRDSSITLNTYVHTSMQQKRVQLDKLPSVLTI